MDAGLFGAVLTLLGLVLLLWARLRQARAQAD
jgi:nitrate reductase gamma subunit